MGPVDNPPNGEPEVPDPATVGVTENDSAADQAAKAENEAIKGDQYAELARAGRHNRSERFQNNYARIALAILWGAGIVILFAMIVLAIHYLLPEKWGWLSDAQREKIQTFLFSGALVGAVLGYVKQQTGQKDE